MFIFQIVWFVKTLCRFANAQMSKPINLRGRRFGRLLVLRRDGSNSGGACLWICRCVCGNKKTVTRNNLQTGNTKSCGCFRREETGRRGRLHIKHGHNRNHKQSPEYFSWQAMIQRCTNPRNVSWKDYGGRGIRVCRRWRNFQSFLVDMGPRPDGKTLDRKRNSCNYEPLNCRWATHKEQRRNRRKRSLTSKLPKM